MTVNERIITLIYITRGFFSDIADRTKILLEE